ncbi:23437_t:CDS:2 [Gigaspora rosea]|nr:23437_t:CDS:2 [Gigaspora rosea]
MAIIFGIIQENYLTMLFSMSSSTIKHSKQLENEEFSPVLIIAPNENTSLRDLKLNENYIGPSAAKEIATTSWYKIKEQYGHPNQTIGAYDTAMDAFATDSLQPQSSRRE